MLIASKGLFVFDNRTERGMNRPPIAVRRRHHSVWLLVGWLAFWFTTAVCPLEHSFADRADHHPSELMLASDALLSPAGDQQDPGGDYHCPDVSAITVNADTATTAKDYSLDNSSPPLVASAFAPQPATGLHGGTQHDLHPPPVRIPLYLRTQRLLI